ncbi:hypothetical protein NE237_019330 [Protea cynaroides]|uniref:Uncharacterized protein n=1 Tax=Protea cynaroides TaxID=273540 RepID=A0A9Q0KBL2_9MAGN|nr:hypothetical protein NE237_019330 [Protea cynaroides]
MVWCDGDGGNAAAETPRRIQFVTLRSEIPLVGFPRHRRICSCHLMAICFFFLLFLQWKKSDFLRVSRCFLAPATQLQVMIAVGTLFLGFVGGHVNIGERSFGREIQQRQVVKKGCSRVHRTLAFILEEK